MSLSPGCPQDLAWGDSLAVLHPTCRLPPRRFALPPNGTVLPAQDTLSPRPFLAPEVSSCGSQDPSTLCSLILLQDNEEKVQKAQKPHTDKVWANPQDIGNIPTATRALAHPSSPWVDVSRWSGWMCPAPVAAEGTHCRIWTEAAASLHWWDLLPNELVTLAAVCSWSNVLSVVGIPSPCCPALTQPSYADGLMRVWLAELPGICRAEQT